MTGNERVLYAFQHKEGDRVPMYEQAFASSVVSKILGRKVFTGSTSLFYEESEAWLKGEEAHKEFEEKIWEDLITITKYFEFDAIHMPWRLKDKPTKQLDEYTFLYGDKESDNWYVRRFDPLFSHTFGVVDSSEKNLQPEDIPKIVERMEKNYVNNYSLTEEHFPETKKYLDFFGDKLAVLGGAGMAIPCTPAWLEAILLFPGAIEKYLDIRSTHLLESIRVQAKMGVRVFWGGGDFAGKNGPFYSPQVFRGFMLPHWQKVAKLCNELNVYYLFRSDGNLWPVAQDLFIKSGLHGYGEIEGDAGMDLGRLKREHGHLTFWGNLSCHLLKEGTAKEVIQETKNCIDKAANGGGYIFGTSNAILHGTPPENVIAMYETAKEYGKY